MLSPHEKAYCQALLALRQKEYAKAETHFSQAAEHFTENRDFMILWETTRALLAVKRESVTLLNLDQLQQVSGFDADYLMHHAMPSDLDVELTRLEFP